VETVDDLHDEGSVWKDLRIGLFRNRFGEHVEDIKMQIEIAEQKLYEIVKQVVSEIIDDRLEKLKDEIRLAALYAEFADEDRKLAEEGLLDYNEGLTKEDAL
jgi:siderophore synthetase component